MINKTLVLTYLYLLIYILLSSGVILYNKVLNFYFATVCVCACVYVNDLLAAVGSVSEILRLSVSYNAHNDPHGVFRSSGVFACSRFQGNGFLLMLGL
jgi:hypothetical protein